MVRGKPSGPLFTDDALIGALPGASSYRGLARSLVSDSGVECSPATMHGAIRRRIVELGLDVSHLEAVNHFKEVPNTVPPLEPSTDRLQHAAVSVAAAWYELHSCTASWPLAPNSFDLLVSPLNGSSPLKVQVKSSRLRDRASGSWRASLTCVKYNQSRGTFDRTGYGEGSIDEFFIVTADYVMYRIPASIVAGKVKVNLNNRYHQFMVTMPQ